MAAWECPDCPTVIHLHPDPEHESHAWTRDFITGHEALHLEQLAEHDGDREALRMRLNHPASYAAVAQLKATTLQPDIQDSLEDV